MVRLAVAQARSDGVGASGLALAGGGWRLYPRPMSISPLFRNVLIGAGVIGVAVAGFSAWTYHVDDSTESIEAYEGRRPKLDEPDPQTLPSVGLLKTIGWGAGEAPVPAKGLSVSRFAEGLDHPRTILVLPNGDVLVAETNAPHGWTSGGLTGFFMKRFMDRVGAGDASPDRLVLLRDAGGTGKATQRFVLRGQGLSSPSGMAWRDGTLYVADHDAVLAFSYRLGDTALAGNPRKIMDLPGFGNHWMRNLLLSPDGKKLYVAVGSASNIGERGMEIEKGRAAIWEVDLASGESRIFAAGLRNPNGLGWNPSTGELWTTVNERDMLGANLVPDYLTNVPVGAHYGWPWVYWKDVVDERVNAPMPEYLTDYTRKPEYSLGPHVAALGMVFVGEGARMGPDFANGAFIARHGSWNRKSPTGYDVVFVKFDDHGNPQGLPVPVLTGFLTGQGATHGRPVWVGWAKDGALLVSDDTAGTIWRVIAPGAAPAKAPKPVVADHMPALKELNADSARQFGEFGTEERVRGYRR